MKQPKPERLAKPESLQAAQAFEQLKVHPEVNAFFSAPDKDQKKK